MQTSSLQTWHDFGCVRSPQMHPKGVQMASNAWEQGSKDMCSPKEVRAGAAGHGTSKTCCPPVISKSIPPGALARCPVWWWVLHSPKGLSPGFLARLGGQNSPLLSTSGVYSLPDDALHCFGSPAQRTSY